MDLEATGNFLILYLPLISAGVTFSLTAIGIYFNSKYQGNKLAQALVLLDQVVIEVVKELNQTVVEELKKAKSDGKLTRDEAEQIKCKAVDLVLKRLGIGMIKILENNLGVVVDLIGTKIEAAVHDLKKRKIGK